MKISLCVICKNEESNIQKCLLGIKSIVDEMIVVDTGSTDRTIAICEELGAIVYHYEWDNNFANAKNYALKKAKGDWIVFLDADEYVLPEKAFIIKQIINKIEKRDPNTDGFVLRHVSIDTTGNILETNHLLRVFRKSNILYRGAIHESVYNISGDLSIADGTKSDIIIYHTGYSSDRIKSKIERNLNLLMHEVETNKSNEITPLYLSDCYMGLGEFTEAIKYATQFIENKYPIYGFNSKPYTTIIRSLFAIKAEHSVRRMWIERASFNFPGHPDFLWLKGLQHLDEMEYSNALDALLYAVSSIEKYKGPESVAITRVLSEIFNHIASLFMLKNDQINAFEYYVKALKENKYMDKAFDGLISITSDYPYEETIPLINSIYDDSEKDVSFLVKNLSELRKGQLLIYYANIWCIKYNKEDITNFYLLYLNGKYEESFKMLCASIVDDKIDKVCQVYIVVTALLSMKEAIIRLAWTKVDDSFKRILEVYIGERDKLFLEDFESMIDLFCELIKICSDNQLKELFLIETYIDKEITLAIAYLLINQKRYELALNYYDNYKAPVLGEALFQLGICYFRLREYSKAEEVFIRIKNSGFSSKKVDEYLKWSMEKIS